MISTPTSSPAARRAASVVAVVAVVAALVVAASAFASNATLATTVRTWSQTIGVDAHSVALAAQNRHPRRMVSSARRFRADALKARAAVRARRASTASGSRAKRLAILAFADYATAGRLWMQTGQARLAGRTGAATVYAAAAARRAKAGNRLLVRAGRLLP